MSNPESRVIYWKLGNNGKLESIEEGENYGDVNKNVFLGSNWRFVSFSEISGTPTIFWHNSRNGKVAYWKLSDTTQILNNTQDDGWGFVNNESTAAQWKLKRLLTVNDLGHLLWYNDMVGKTCLWKLNSAAKFDEWFYIYSNGSDPARWRLDGFGQLN